MLWLSQRLALAQLFELLAELAVFFIAHQFLLSETMNRQTMVTQIWISSRLFSKMNKVSLSLQGKQLTVFVANDKTRASKLNFKIWNICICHCELESFQYFKNFSDEIHGDINKREFFLELCIMEYSNIWNICIMKSTDIFQWPMHVITKSCIRKRSFQTARQTNGF